MFLSVILDVPSSATERPTGNGAGCRTMLLPFCYFALIRERRRVAIRQAGKLVEAVFSDTSFGKTD